MNKVIKITGLLFMCLMLVEKSSGQTLTLDSIFSGLEANGYTEITMGLEKGEVVVITGAYLLNSEFILRSGANPMEGHDMSKM